MRNLFIAMALVFSTAAILLTMPAVEAIVDGTATARYLVFEVLPHAGSLAAAAINAAVVAGKLHRPSVHLRIHDGLPLRTAG